MVEKKKNNDKKLYLYMYIKVKVARSLAYSCFSYKPADFAKISSVYASLGFAERHNHKIYTYVYIH